MNNDNPIIKGIGNIPEKFVSDVRNIIEQGRSKAYSSVNRVMIETYWNIGKRIVEEEQQGNERAEYGKMLIKDLSARLMTEYGKGYSQRYLAYFRQFYLTIPDVMILQTRLQNLSWSYTKIQTTTAN